MKKFNIIVMPLITLSFLASCNNKNDKVHYVVFETSGGTHIEPQKIKNGEKASKPDNPTRNDDIFEGWRTDSGNEYTFEEEVKTDITLFAQWTEIPPEPTTYHFKFTGHNCFVEKEESYETDILASLSETFQITLKDGYSLPTDDISHFNVKKGEDIVNYNSETGVITINEMASDVEIEATAIPIDRFSFSFSGIHCSINGENPYVDYLQIGENKQYTVLPEAGYLLPTIDIPDSIKEFVSYEDGVFTITGMADNVEFKDIEAPKKEIIYSISFNGINCKAKGGTVTDFTKSFQISRSSEDLNDVVLTLQLDDPTYSLPDSIEIYFDGVKGVPSTDYVYDVTSQTITIKKMGHVSINVKAFNPEEIFTITFDAGEGATYVTTGAQKSYLEAYPNSNLSAIVRSNIAPNLANKTFAYYTYNDGSMIDYNSVVTDSITIKAHYFDIVEPLNDLDTIPASSEEERLKIIKAVAATNCNPSKVFALGASKTITVNEIDQKIRIIGFNQDADVNDVVIGITFEFANLISDKDGNSLATQWHDTNTIATSNNDYFNSSIRKALNGKGSGHILWAQKDATTWSTDSLYQNKSVLDMLPSSLVNVMTAPQKFVKCIKSGSGVWTDELIVDNKGEADKLFLLSNEEMGEDTDWKGAYSYYKESDEEVLKSLRIKKQINTDDILVPAKCKQISIGAGQVYEATPVYNTAGSNVSADETGGGVFWLRSPYTGDNATAYYISTDGVIAHDIGVYYAAMSLAPAFCI